MKNEFVLAFNEVLEEKQLPKEVVLEALEAAMVSAYRRAVNASNAQHVESKVDSETGKVTIYAEKEVVDKVQDPRTEVSLVDAHKVDPEAQIGSMVVVETTPRNFGRVAAQTARQVIQQRIREAERDAQHSHFSEQVGEILSGVVQALGNQGVTLGLDMKAEGLMPRTQQIPGERFRVHDRVRALLLEVKNSPRGPQIILSRAHRNFLRRLLENEVPEIYHGLVEIRSIAREPGQRSKVAVAALQPGVDPVGACVGIRGVRIQAIVRELNDEKIDVIEWNPDTAAFIAKALSPARVTGVYLNEHVRGTKTATVVVPEDQLSLAIGRDGQNARLAAKLTSWRIDIKSLPEATSDALHRIRTEPEYAELAGNEADVIPQIELTLAKKAEGRPVTPEEYQTMAQFVDRVEKGIGRLRDKAQQAEEEKRKIAQADIPEAAFEMSIDDFEVSDRLYAVLTDARIENVGEIMLRMRTDPDSILAINGMGPKGMKELEEALDKLSFPEEEQPVEAAAEELEPEAEVETAVEAVEAAPEPEAELEEATEPLAELEEAPAAEVAEPVAAEEVVEEAEAQPEEIEAVAVEEVEPEPVAAVPEEEPEEVPAATAPIGEEEEEEEELEEMFAMSAEMLETETEFEEFEEEEEEEEGSEQKKGKKRKKRKYTQLVYDPDKDVMVAKKKRKRGGREWDEWDY